MPLRARPTYDEESITGGPQGKAEQQPSRITPSTYNKNEPSIASCPESCSNGRKMEDQILPRIGGTALSNYRVCLDRGSTLESAARVVIEVLQCGML
jgi:hypothetical protein